MARQAHRASLFHLPGDPAGGDPLAGWHEDGGLVVEDWSAVAPTLGAEVPVTVHPNALIVPARRPISWCSTVARRRCWRAAPRRRGRPGEMLFAMALLGDDRAVKHTFIAGHLAHSRDRHP